MSMRACFGSLNSCTICETPERSQDGEDLSEESVPRHFYGTLANCASQDDPTFPWPLAAILWGLALYFCSGRDTATHLWLVLLLAAFGYRVHLELMYAIRAPLLLNQIPGRTLKKNKCSGRCVRLKVGSRSSSLQASTVIFSLRGRLCDGAGRRR